ncbi:MAG: SH3 domain-containing protein [Bacillota bacterium]|nr:SH3 domain-containing protein [Bacillota bacterium]
MSTYNKKFSTRVFSVAAAFIVALSILAVLPMIDSGKVYATGETAKVTASLLYVRSGAGTGYSKIGSLKKGKTFTVKGSSKDKNGVKWYKLTYSGKTGYVSSKYVNIIQPTVTAMSNTTGTVKNGPLNVRKGPGTNYGKLGTIAKGKSFTVTGKAKDKNGKWWYRFSFNGKTGYVHSSYVTAKTTTSGNISVTEISNLKGTVTNGPLNVRKGPGTSYGTLGTVAKGKVITITGKAKDKDGKWWYRFTFNGKDGYVYSSYIKTSDASSSSGESSSSTAKPVSFKMGTVTTSDGLNVRKGAGTSYAKLTILSKGTTVAITGSEKDKNNKTWYSYQYSSSQKGYVCSDYISTKTITSSSEFEAYLTAQGFPESYKPGLRALHAAHPNWTFKAINVGYSWNDALSKESKVGVNLVSPSAPVSYRSKASGAYNSKTGVWAKFDGSWYAADSKVIAYYMDPRNFLNESGIYQFMTHKYDSGSQNASTVKSVISGSFMAGKNPPGDYSTYESLINDAGKNNGVNPNVLAAMIIQEQGWSGSSLSSGTYTGSNGIYKGYYNFFNIRAYVADGKSAVQNGLAYAKSQGWNTPYKSICGGAAFYAANYVKNKQDTYYTKKFNVNNGYSNVASHQYMTYVAAAASEGELLKRAYSSNSSAAAVFEIPVFNSMPSSACPLP